MKKWIKIIGIATIVAILGAATLGAVAYAQGGFNEFGFGPRGFRSSEGFGPGGFFEGGPRGFRDGPGFGRGGFGPGEFFEGGTGGFGRGGFGPAAGFAERGHGPRGPRGVGGEVTAKNDDSLTVLNHDSDSVTVNVSEETRVMLAETQTEGSLDDVTVGSNVGVMGPRNDDGSVDARGIVVLPTGDIAGGRVTAVDGSTISVENPKDGAATIITNDSTTFRVNRNEEGSLSDVAVDKHVVAFGEAQEDGSVVARLVHIHDARGKGERGPRGGAAGEVTAIDGATLTLDPFRGDDAITVLTDENTQYRTRDGSDVSFDSIEVGSQIMVKGQPVDGQDNTIQAEVIGIRPQ